VGRGAWDVAKLASSRHCELPQVVQQSGRREGRQVLHARDALRVSRLENGPSHALTDAVLIELAQTGSTEVQERGADVGGMRCGW
jgi:hypothetical protein